METKERIDNTIKVVYEILKENQNNEKNKKAYEDIKTLKEKRNIE